ncbi:MAG: hypothetical protein AABY22_23940, partial [Nanoarchaeota archaeon]
DKMKYTINVDIEVDAGDMGEAIVVLRKKLQGISYWVVPQRLRKSDNLDYAGVEKRLTSKADVVDF